jgi:DNA-binding transcriptional ArsR family regulator
MVGSKRKNEQVTGAGEPADDTYWVTDPAQIRCGVSPRRHDIIDRLAASGPMSIRELAGWIGARPSALYHHVNQLLEVGLILKSGFRTVNRRREQLYATPARRMRLIRALGDPNNREVMAEVVAALTRQMERDFRRGLKTPGAVTEGPARDLGFFRLLGSPSPEALVKINALLEEIAELLWTGEAEDSGVVAFNWIMAPIRRSDDGDDEPDTE